jgi:hypothetical protein
LVVWRQAGRLRWEMLCFAGAGLVTTFLALQWSAPLWDLPVLGAILGSAQFPWRWMSITALCVSILAGLVLYRHPAEASQAEASPALDLQLLAVIAVILLGSYPMLQVEITEPAEGPVGLAALMRFQQSSDEMTGSTAWVKEIPVWSPMADYYMSLEREGKPVTPVTSLVDYTTLDYDRNGGFVVNSETRNTLMEKVWYWSPLEGRRIVFNHFYYPGWRAYLLSGRDGEPVQELPVIPEEEGTLGRMTVPVPPGEGYVVLRFEDTPPRVVGRWISLSTLTLLAVVGVAGLVRRQRASLV